MNASYGRETLPRACTRCQRNLELTAVSTIAPKVCLILFCRCLVKQFRPARIGPFAFPAASPKAPTSRLARPPQLRPSFRPTSNTTPVFPGAALASDTTPVYRHSAASPPSSFTRPCKRLRQMRPPQFSPHRRTSFSAAPAWRRTRSSPHRHIAPLAFPPHRNTAIPTHRSIQLCAAPAFPPHRNTDTPPVSALPPNRLSHRFPALRSIPRFSSESLVVADSPLIAATASSSPDTA